MAQEYRSRGRYIGVTWNEAGLFNVQILRPISTNSSGNFLKSTDNLTGNIHTMLNEVIPDGSTYAYAPVAGAAGSLRHAAGSTPIEKSGHKVRYQIKGDGTAGMTMRLRQGATTIATWTHNPEPIADSVYEYELTSGEAATITNYAILDVEIQGV